MTDIVDSATRSRMMAGIRSRNTRPEMLIRRALHRMGFRFRLHRPDLPGNPDIVLHRHKAVIFIHGCFWHQHQECRNAKLPSTRPDFWKAKFTANKQRDAAQLIALQVLGWRVAVVWECAVRQDADQVMTRLSAWVKQGESSEPLLDVGAAHLDRKVLD